MAIDITIDGVSDIDHVTHRWKSIQIGLISQQKEACDWVSWMRSTKDKGKETYEKTLPDIDYRVIGWSLVL